MGLENEVGVGAASRRAIWQVAAGERGRAGREAQRHRQEVAVAPRPVLLVERRAWKGW